MHILRNTILFVWAGLRWLAGAETVPVPVTPTVQPAAPIAPPVAERLELQLKEPDKIRVLEVQRAQYKALANREKAHAEHLEAQKSLDDANALMNDLQTQLRKDYKCPGCELVEALKLVRPLPKELTVLPNQQ